MVDLNAFALLRALARGELAHGDGRVRRHRRDASRPSSISAQGSPRLVRSLPTGGQQRHRPPSPARWGSPRPRPRRVKREVGIGFAVGARAGRRRRGDQHRRAVRSSSRCATRSSTTRATTPARASTSSSSPVAARTCPGSGSTCRARAGCPVTLGDPLAGPAVRPRPCSASRSTATSRSSPSPSDSPTELPHDHARSNARASGAAAGTALSGRPAAGQPAAARGPGGARRCGTPSGGSSSASSSTVACLRRRLRARARLDARPPTAELADGAGRDRRGSRPSRRSTPRCRRCSAHLEQHDDRPHDRHVAPRSQWKPYLDAIAAVLPAGRQHRRRFYVIGATPHGARRTPPTDPLQTPSVGHDLRSPPRVATLPDTAAWIDALNSRPRASPTRGVSSARSPRTTHGVVLHRRRDGPGRRDAAYSHRFDADRG